MSDYLNLQNIDFSFLGKGSKIQGTFHLYGPTFLASEVEGELYMENQAPLCIERDGVFKGKIKCHDVDIYGNFEGNLEAAGKVTVHPPASLRGKIASQNLVIHPGASLNIDGYTAP